LDEPRCAFLTPVRLARRATEALLVRVDGFDSDMVAGLVRAGLATAESETMKAGVKPIEVIRLRITAAGQNAIDE
jgi:hypothetical protein